MRIWPWILVNGAFANLLAAACVSQTDPPYGAPGAIANHKFPGESSGTTSSGGSGTDGGSSGAADPFPAPYNATTPAAPAALAPIHPGVANGAPVGPTVACMTCHGPTGISTKKWAFAGYAASGPGASTPLDKGEVIVTGSPGTIGPVKTSPDGYFWIDVASGTVGANASTSIRDNTGKVSSMTQKLGGIGDCNLSTCHGGGAGPVDFKP